MIYEGVFFSFDLVLSLVAVLIVPGGFERDCLFIAARFLPPWAEIVDPSPVFEKRGGRVGNLSPWLDPRPPDLGVLAGKAEILGRSPPSPPFWHMGARLLTSWGASGSLFCWKRIIGVLFRTIFIESSFIAHCEHFNFILIIDIIWSCRSILYERGHWGYLVIFDTVLWGIWYGVQR